MKMSEARDGEGKRVVYKPESGVPPQFGTITGFSTGFYVFVRYDGDPNSKATSPADLEFLTREQLDNLQSGGF